VSLGLLGVMLASTPAEAQPFAYVTNFSSNTVSVIDTATNTVVATVPVGTNPEGVAITPDGTRAYVANNGSGTVSLIDTASNTVVATVQVGTNPEGVAITPDGTHAYVTNAGDHTVSVIETATHTVVATVPVGLGLGAAGGGVAITPDGTHTYLTNEASVSVIETATNTEVATFFVGNSPRGVAITPDGTHAYVADVTGSVRVFDTATNTVVASVLLGQGSGPSGVAITPDGTHAYVTEHFTDFAFFDVAVIDTATNTVVATVHVGTNPEGVAITPDGTRAYVANMGSGTVSVIDTATNTVVATVPVDRGAFGVAIGPARNLLVRGDFEDYVPPDLGPPGWIADLRRQVAAKSETYQPHSGLQNGACWTPDALDCGMFQGVTAPGTGVYTLTYFANADRDGGLVGASVNDKVAASSSVAVRGFRNYGAMYSISFNAVAGDTIWVWMYSPPTPGYVVIDDVSLTFQGLAP